MEQFPLSSSFRFERRFRFLHCSCLINFCIFSLWRAYSPWVRFEVCSDSEGLSDCSGEEIDALLLDPEEQQAKSDIWHEVNKDFLEDWGYREAAEERTAANPR